MGLVYTRIQGVNAVGPVGAFALFAALVLAVGHVHTVVYDLRVCAVWICNRERAIERFKRIVPTRLVAHLHGIDVRIRRDCADPLESIVPVRDVSTGLRADHRPHASSMCVRKGSVAPPTRS